MDEAVGRADIERAIMEKAARDEAFRARLLADPKATLEREILALTGREVRLPAGVTVSVHEETSESVHIVVPAVPERSLTEEELARSVGGGGGVPAPAPVSTAAGPDCPLIHTIGC